ncbi:MAG TPA: hypothetical protein VGC57_12730 [Cellulomonas sp.]
MSGRRRTAVHEGRHRGPDPASALVPDAAQDGRADGLDRPAVGGRHARPSPDGREPDDAGTAGAGTAPDGDAGTVLLDPATLRRETSHDSRLEWRLPAQATVALLVTAGLVVLGLVLAP